MKSYPNVRFRISKPAKRTFVQGYVFVPRTYTVAEKAIACALRFVDENGKKISPSVPGYDRSTPLEALYVYLPPKPRPDGLYPIPVIRFPMDAVFVDLFLVKWTAESTIDVNNLTFLTLKDLPGYCGQVLQAVDVAPQEEPVHA